MQRECIAAMNPYLILLKSNATEEDYKTLVEEIDEVGLEYHKAPMSYGTAAEFKRRENITLEANPARLACVAKFMQERGYECSGCGMEFECLPTFEIFIAHIHSHPPARLEDKVEYGMPSMVDIMLEAQKLKKT